MVADFELAVQQLIRFTAMWRGEDAAEATFKLRANLKPDFAPADSATVLINLADRNYLSPETLFAECQRRDIISDQAGSWAEEQARLAKSEDGYLMLSAKAKAQVTDSNPAQAIADGSPQDPKNK
jgi:hypothetical protein